MVLLHLLPLLLPHALAVRLPRWLLPPHYHFHPRPTFITLKPSGRSRRSWTGRWTSCLTIGPRGFHFCEEKQEHQWWLKTLVQCLGVIGQRSFPPQTTVSEIDSQVSFLDRGEAPCDASRVPACPHTHPRPAFPQVKARFANYCKNKLCIFQSTMWV